MYWKKLGKNILYPHLAVLLLIVSIATAFLTFSIINIIRYRKYNSPIYSAAKMISLIASIVSMLALEIAMLTTFGTEDIDFFNQIILILSGFAISIFVITMAIIMIIKARKKLVEFDNIDKKTIN